MSRARVPASSANLGPGFDTLALALSLYVTVEVEPGEALRLECRGEGSDLPRDDRHLAARVVREVAGDDRFTITVDSEIPVGRGLGSSAALAVAAAAAAGAPDPLAVAAAVDGHPENASASVTGGLVTATMVDGEPVTSSLPLDPSLSFVVVVPERGLATERARAALPEVVPHGDAAFNLGRMGLLLAGLADHRRLVPEAADDRLHQPHRTPLFPESIPIIQALKDAGASAVAWSGAGPSLVAMVTADTAAAVVTGAEGSLAALALRGRVLHLEPDLQGLVVG